MPSVPPVGYADKNANARPRAKAARAPRSWIDSSLNHIPMRLHHDKRVLIIDSEMGIAISRQEQFEAYRNLGFHAVNSTFERADIVSMNPDPAKWQGDKSTIPLEQQMRAIIG
jgi:hypothetical protein